MQIPGVAELYSADLEWVEGSGRQIKNKRSHPIFYIHSFIESVFPDSSAKTWEWFMPLRTALLTSQCPGIGYVQGEIDGIPIFHRLMPIYAEVLAMLSGVKSLQDQVITHAALTRLVRTLHVSDWKDVNLRDPIDSGSAFRLISQFEGPRKVARIIADTIKYRSAAERNPRSIITSKMEVKKTIREGIAESRTLVLSLNLQQKEFKDIVDSLFHKMRKIVIESRFQYLDRLVEKSNDPTSYQPKMRIRLGAPLQELQLQEIARFYDRLVVVKDECEILQREFDVALRDLFFSLEDS